MSTVANYASPWVASGTTAMAVSTWAAEAALRYASWDRKRGGSPHPKEATAPQNWGRGTVHMHSWSTFRDSAEDAPSCAARDGSAVNAPSRIMAAEAL
ncbi:hypothetical protein HYPSUDRAFT_914440 [Hypholoma sublateritium FD-334 SS-4]|uniref:Uncharacterized protein n=1 Tax=Hypholoma sublateritium (strain FD-334 SS-4) TaxID=945553 RepID=A0A0D2KVZ7_HYPSF|nr:hypothetical protein HYPSUDRAFT_914440 [Hypholoma sublateritium FD-334 SS-4]